MPSAALAEGHGTGACGTVSDGRVECDSSDAPFPQGIDYWVGFDLTVDVEDGLTVQPDAGYAGIMLASDASVTLNAAGADVIATDASAIVGFATDDLTIVIDDVSATGPVARGIDTFTFWGDAQISADTVTTSGDYALGVNSQSTAGNITIDVNNVDTSGFAADAITVRTGGDIDVAVGSIEGEGDYLWGVNAFSGNYVDGEVLYGNTRVDVGSIAISGDYAAGVIAISYGELDVSVGELNINGDFGAGISAAAIGNVSIEVGDAAFTGENSGGIVGFSYSEASVRVGTLAAESGGGIVAFGVEGAYASADSVSVSGDFQNGIQSVSMYGDAVLRVGEVSSNGLFAVAVNGDSGHGDVTIEAGTITTAGELAMGIRAFGRTTSIDLTGPLSTSGDWAFGMLNASLHGDALVRAAGPISTSGDFAEALWITGRYGTADIEVGGRVSTSGDNAKGIRATGEDGQVRVVANEVTTSGANANGIHARTRYVEIFLGQPGLPDPVPFTGDIDIDVETVSVTGPGSIGISARGLGDANIAVGSVSARNSFGIDVNMIGDASLTVSDGVGSTRGTAVRMEAEDLTIAIEQDALVSGRVHGIVVSAQGERCVSPNPRDGGPNPCPNPGDDDFNDPVPVAGPGGIATITNAGTIRAGSGFAVKVENGTVTLNNSGRIVGAVQLHDGDDVIDNSGTFIVGGNSNFGGGDDLFDNSGTVRLQLASTAGTYRFLNLESFENAGMIDLRNSVAGDIFSVSGDYAGSADATVALDIDFSANIADRLVVAGAASGSTEVLLGLTSETARLTGGTGLALVAVGAGSQADAFTLADASRDIGLIRYGLSYDAAARRYLLSGIAGGGAYRQLNILEGAENLWHASAEPWRANEAANRDATFAGTEAMRSRGTVWAQLLGGELSRDAQSDELGIGGDQSVDYAYSQDRAGGQLGVDFASLGGRTGGARIGITAGFAESTLESRSVSEEIAFDTYNLGLYGGFSSGALFGSVLAKRDWHDGRVNSQAAGFSGGLDGSTWGIEGEVGARFGARRFFVEPVASLAWTRTSFDDLEVLGQALEFRRANGLRGKLGARFGGRSDVGNGDALVYYASAKAVHDMGGRYRLDLVSNGVRQELSSDRVDTFGEGVIGASYFWRGGVETFIEGQGELGSDYDGVGGRAGIRMKF